MKIIKKMDDNSDNSPSFEQIIKNLKEGLKPNDIQDLSDFPRDSFVEHKSNNYFNNKNQKSPFQPQHFPIDYFDDDSSSDEREYGYSINFMQNMPFQQQFKTSKKKSNNNNYMNNNNNYHNNTDINSHTNNLQYQSYNNNYNYNLNYNNNFTPEIQGPIPQDTQISDENEEQEQEQIPEPEIEKEEFFNNENSGGGDDQEQIKIPSPSYDKKKLQELLSLCQKNGIPPSDDDFTFTNWKVFYPKSEKFFLWTKGQVIPNQVIIKNEDDPDNLEIYQGEINFQNEKHGIGRLTAPKYVRVGTWRDDQFTGWGRESRVNGDVFEGRFVDGAIYGKGINQNKKGNVYVGEFLDNKRHGRGELKTSKVHYEGEFKYDKFNGKGKLIFLKQGHEYEGEFKDNEINGMGIFKWKNGDIYEGEMIKGKMHGYGKYKYSSGQIYEGQFANGVKEGLGKLISPNNIFEGEFKQGNPFGEGTISIKGKKIKVVYKNGKFEKK